MMIRWWSGTYSVDHNDRYSTEVVNFIKIIMPINLMGQRVIVSEVKEHRRNAIWNRDWYLQTSQTTISFQRMLVYCINKWFVNC